jgi:hypothetical protein
MFLQRGKEVVLYDDLYIRTQYDGKDLMSVEEIYYYNEDGDEQICEEATDACIDVTTCADQGTDLWPWIRKQVELRLQQVGISCQNIYFDDERGNQ